MSGFDASIGLEASLDICRYYRHNGTLKASVKGIRVLRGISRIEIIIQDGIVTSCLLINRQGREEPADIKQLIEQTGKLSYGEIAWIFTPLSPSNRVTASSPSQLGWNAVPKRIIPALAQQHLQNYTADQRRLLLNVFASIDGIATFEILFLQSTCPRPLFEQIIVTLLHLHAISYT